MVSSPWVDSTLPFLPSGCPRDSSSESWATQAWGYSRVVPLCLCGHRWSGVSVCGSAVRVVAPSLVSCVWLAIFNLSVSLFPHWQYRDKESVLCRIIVRIKRDNAHKTLRTVPSIWKHSITVIECFITIYVSSVVIVVVVLLIMLLSLILWDHFKGPVCKISPSFPKNHRAAAQFWPCTDCQTFSWPPEVALFVLGSMSLLPGAGRDTWGLSEVGKLCLLQLLSLSYFLLCLMRLSEVKAGSGCLLLNKTFLLPRSFPFIPTLSPSSCQQLALFLLFANLKKLCTVFTLPLGR